MTDKKIIVDAFIKAIEKNLESSQAGINMQKDYLADQPGPMQSRYDSALVEGQWQLSEMQKSHKELLRALTLLRELAESSRNSNINIIQSGSLVVLENENKKLSGYLVLDAKGGAGTQILIGNIKYTIITLESPLGQALCNKKQGERVSLKTSRPVNYLVKEIM